MNIIINGKKQDLDCSLTLQVFIEQIYSNPNHIIAEVNEDVIKREKWENYTLKNGDQIELVTFMGGGQTQHLRPSIWHLELHKN